MKPSSKDNLVAHDAEVLRKLGYKQVLYRTWGTFTTITIAISAMSVLTSIAASFGTGLTYGGPAVCVWGWVAVSVCMLCVALGIAELASAYPTSGGMYYYQYKLASEKVAPVACWATGWLNLLGQVAGISSVTFLCANLISTIAMMANAAAGAEPISFTPAQELGIYTGCLFFFALVNSCGLRVLTLCTQIGGMFHLVGITLLIFMVPLMATQHQPTSWVFGHFEKAQAMDVGIINPLYIAVLGLLLPAWSYTGMDGPCHMSEEVAGASMGPPIAILVGWGVMFVGGLSLMISLLFSITDLSSVLSEDSPAGGNAMAQILYDASMQRFGNPNAGIFLMVVVLLGVVFCSASSLTFIARILFCYARDRAVPFSNVWSKVDPRTKSPVLAVWGVALGAFLLGLPRIGSHTAFSAVLSLSTISLSVVYVTPIMARISWGRAYFKPGPFNLGVWAYPVGCVATVWMLFAAVVFCLPVELPPSPDNLNYASVAFLGTTSISLFMFYFPKYGAHKWFKGPVHTVDDDGTDMDVQISNKDVYEDV